MPKQPKNKSSRKPGEVVTGRSQGRLAAARFMAGTTNVAVGGARKGSDGSNGTSGPARAVFFEGFQCKKLATALDVERCGRHKGELRHGCTSLLVQEKGAVTQLHFDTGPYSAISFHLCQAPR